MLPHVGPRLAALLAVSLSWPAMAGCTREAPPARISATWVAGRAQPAFDPDGPPDALRWALERQLSFGLVERDSSGRLHLALADSVGCSSDSLVWTFRLRAGLSFTDGSAVRSTHVRDALVGGLAREDHATRAWLLAGVAGMGRVRAGRRLPALGIETPDPRTIVLELERPDRRLLEKLALPGVSTPWKRRTGGWREAIGVGPYRVLSGEGEKSLTLVSAPTGAIVAPIADTVHVRFAVGPARVGSLLRMGRADVVWPLPPGLLEQPLPPRWSLERRVPVPGRRLLLVLRADVPPFTRAEVRRSLAHAINREELIAALGERGAPLRLWLPGATAPYQWPRLEPAAGLRPLDNEARVPDPPGRVERHGRGPQSFHVVLAYDADLSGAEIAPVLQGQWARAGHYADLRPLRGRAAAEQALAAAAGQAQLVESQALLTGAEAELASLVMPLRGPAVGGFRTGWRTREFDRWVAMGEAAPGFDPDAVQRQLSDDRVILPVASLPWLMAFRTGAVRCNLHPAFGPGWTAVNYPAGEKTPR